MTEYTTSSEAFREFMSSRERTALWVRTHSPTREEFYSPSAPPLDLPPTPTSPPSEVESSSSVPPRMVLKYKDGRADIPISHWHHDSAKPNTKRHDADPGQRRQSQQQQPQSHHTRSRSHGATTTTASITTDRDHRLGRSASRKQERPQAIYRPLTPLSPEEIRVFPSDSDAVPRPLQPRSKSLPRDAHVREEAPPPPLPGSPARSAPLQTMFPPSSRHTPPLSPHNNNHNNSQRVVHPQPRPVAWHSMPNPPPPKVSSRPPPAIVYAPSHHSKTNYSPPPIVPAYAHHTVGGMKYSHSAPIRYADLGEPPFPLVHDGRSATLSSVSESRSSGFRGRGGDSSRRSDRESDDSGSTYYVLPTAGQKVHIIVSLCVFFFYLPRKLLIIDRDVYPKAPESSIYTATSTTKSPSSPNSKKPFFHRLFEKFTSADSSKASSASGKRLHRRHSTGRGIEQQAR
jgi:hypothetical protein